MGAWLVYLAGALALVVCVWRCLTKRIQMHRDPNDPWAG